MNFRTFRRSALCLTAAFSICSVAAQAPLKVGTVDVARVVQEHPKTKEAETQVNQAGAAAKKEFEERIEAYKKLVEETNKLVTQAEAPALSAEAKSAKGKERDTKIGAVRKMEGEIEEFRESREQQLQQQVARVRETIVKEIADAVLERVKANNYDLVFDKSGPGASGISPILYSHENADFTADVIAAMKRGSAAATPAKATKP